MKIIQSFWSKPYYSRDYYFNNAGGWSHRTFNYMGWALSCLRLKKYYEHVELVTDTFGKNLLIDIIGLPYDSVSLKLDELNCKYNRYENIWALGKIHAFSIQREPFIHVDGDVFIWDKFPEKIEKAPLIAQQIEYDNSGFHQKNLNEVLSKLRYTPESILSYYSKTNDASQYNAGIIGGNDLSFFYDFTKTARDIVDHNLHCTNEKFAARNSFSCFFEQYLFLCLVKMQDSKVETLIPINKNCKDYFKGLSDFHRAHETKFIHLIGSNKLNFNNGELVSYLLWNEFPDYYNKITKLVSDKTI